MSSKRDLRRWLGDRGFLREILPYVWRDWGRLGVALLAMLVLAIAQSGYAALTGPVLRALFGVDLRGMGGPLGKLAEYVPALTQSSAWIPAAIVLVAVLKGLAQGIQFTVTGQIAQRVTRQLRERAFARVLLGRAELFAKHSTADLLTRLTTDAERVEQSVFYGLMPIVRETLALVGLLAYCVSLDAKLSFFAFLVIPISALPLVRFSKRLKKVARRSQDQMSRMSEVSHEALLGIRTLQAFGLEAQQRERFQRSADEHQRAMFGSYLVRGVRTPVMEVLGALGTALLVFWLTQRVSAGAIDAAHVASFASAVLLMYDPVKKLGNVGEHLAQGDAALSRIRELMDAPAVDLEEGQGGAAGSTARAVGVLAVEHLTYRYPDGTVALQDVSFASPAGASVALVGPSGAGKSTFIHLLLRLFDPSEGRVLVDGRATVDWSRRALREQMSWVSQDVFLFDMSVKENLTLGKHYTDAEIAQALDSAGASEFVRELPDGLETRLGERALRLSGGQRQRLAIARAFLRDSPILLLDEPTSALDARSEQLVKDALQRLMKGRTTVIVAHRLATVQQVDQIIVLDRGQVVDRGTHRELLQRGGIYAEFAKLQLLEQA